MRGATAMIGLRDGLLAVPSTGFGLTIGYLDSRPAWDDTGITAALLLLTAAIAAGPAIAAIGALGGYLLARASETGP